MTTTHPARNKIATPAEWEVATVEDVWRASDATGAPSCAVLAAMKHLGRLNPEHVCDLR